MQVLFPSILFGSEQYYVHSNHNSFCKDAFCMSSPKKIFWSKFNQLLAPLKINQLFIFFLTFSVPFYHKSFGYTRYYFTFWYTFSL
jgi:hypothetical protein